jgi:hypothetical protein
MALFIVIQFNIIIVKECLIRKIEKIKEGPRIGNGIGTTKKNKNNLSGSIPK